MKSNVRLRSRIRNEEMIKAIRERSQKEVAADANALCRRNRRDCTGKGRLESSPWLHIGRCNIYLLNGKCMEDARTFSIVQQSLSSVSLLLMMRGEIGW
ncbi:MAG TPA: hypothetical protein VKS20_07220 [Candidatus Acidoferrales bacterium]|nr:hypothetical protein [Candidatus Acidoferrales bacterium]